MRCQDDINTEHNMKSICRAAVAQWTKRLTRNGQTRVRIREAHIFDITLDTRYQQRALSPRNPRTPRALVTREVRYCSVDLQVDRAIHSIHYIYKRTVIFLEY